MFLSVQTSEEIQQLIVRLQQYTQSLFEDFELPSNSITLEGVDSLYELFDRDKIFIIQDGMLHLDHHGQTLVSFDEGDLVGFTNAFGLPYPVLRTEEYVELIAIERDQFLQHIYSDSKRMHSWSHFLICINAILTNQLAAQSQALIKPSAGFINFKPGDIMIQQGDNAEFVYTIVEGVADALVDGVLVGEVQQDEVFGAMSIFTGEPRSATVKARTHCTVMAVPKGDFVSLIEVQPKAAVHLIETLAHKITTLNQQLIEKCEKN